MKTADIGNAYLDMKILDKVYIMEGTELLSTNNYMVSFILYFDFSKR